MRDLRELGTSYAALLNEVFDDLFTEVLDNEDLHSESEVSFARKLKQRFEDRQEAWYETPHDLLGQNGLSDFLSSLSESEVIQFLLGLSQVSDYPFPDLVKPRLSEFSESAIDDFYSKIIEIEPADLGEDSDERLREIFFLNQFLPLAALWPQESRVDQVVDWLLATPLADERVEDAVGLYLKTIGPAAAAPLKARIEQAFADENYESKSLDLLLQQLTQVSKFDDTLRQEAYTVVRQAFKNFSDKTIPTLCLGDLGTARAIPLLRTYIEKNQRTIDRRLYYDILSSIQRLGGTIKDLPDPFGDHAAGQGSAPITYL